MAVTNLPFIQQQMILYGMTVYFAFGLFGNICNCIMFTRQSYRHTPSAVYFLSLSILVIIYLMWSVPPYIYTANHTDPQKYSLFYCKIKLYISHVVGLWNRYIIVSACADRFFATQTNARLRSLSSVRIARKIVCSVGPMWIVIAIHLPILMDIRSSTCGMFGLYKLIYAVYQITFSAIIPPILMAIFSILAIRNLHQRDGIQVRVRQQDRYIMRMVIAEMSINIFTALPYSVNLVYGAVTYNVVNKSAEQLELDSFLSFLAQFIIYLFNVIPFYLFIFTSKPFRKEFIRLIIKCWKKYITRSVQVIPLHEQNNTTRIHGRMIYERH